MCVCLFLISHFWTEAITDAVSAALCCCCYSTASSSLLCAMLIVKCALHCISHSTTSCCVDFINVTIVYRTQHQLCSSYQKRSNHIVRYCATICLGLNCVCLLTIASAAAVCYCCCLSFCINSFPVSIFTLPINSYWK